MPKYLKYTLLALLWGGVAAYLLYAGGKVRRHRAEQPVTRIEVEVVDSTSQLRLVSEATVRGWLARSGIKTVFLPADNVPDLEEITGDNNIRRRPGYGFLFGRAACRRLAADASDAAVDRRL